MAPIGKKDLVMTIVAQAYDYVIGIGTHSRTHTYAVINTTTCARTGCEAFPLNPKAMNRAIAWIRCNTHGHTLLFRAEALVMCSKFNEPRYIVHVGFPARNVACSFGIDEDERKCSSTMRK